MGADRTVATQGRTALPQPRSEAVGQLQGVIGSGLGIYRWVVEQAFALLHWFRRLCIRWEIRDDIHEAFLSIARSIICWRRLKTNSIC
jgi:hypothetical protein